MTAEVDADAIDFEARGVSADIVLLFQDGDFEAAFGEFESGCEASGATTEYDDSGHERFFLGGVGYSPRVAYELLGRRPIFDIWSESRPTAQKSVPPSRPISADSEKFPI